MLANDWRAQLEREGVELPDAPVVDGDEPPCPACGCALPLVEGACADCGLQLG